MREWRGNARRAAIAGYRRLGAACAGAGVAAAFAGSFEMAAGCAAALAAWTCASALPGPSDWIRKHALGTREPRENLFEAELSRMPASFRELDARGRALAARADRAMQRRMWWEASSVMWMAANPGLEHRWRSSVATPGWLDDARAWREETRAKLVRAAEAGWICPKATVAWLMEMPEREGEARAVGSAIPSFSFLPEPWPSQARFDHTLGAMGRDLYGSDLGERLAGASQGAIDALALGAELGPGGPRRGAKRI